MTDIEIQRKILQHIYDHRHENIIDLQETGVDTSTYQYSYNVQLLADEGYLKIIDATAVLVQHTPKTIRLCEDPKEFGKKFPIKHDIPKQTQELIDTVEGLLKGKYEIPLQQFIKAKRFLFDNAPPDFLNCVKEAVLTVEGVAKILINEPKGTLKDLLPKLRQEHLAHPAMAKILEGVYAVRGDEPNIAHAGIEKSSFGYAEAEFMLNTCASIIIYLVRK